MGEAWLRQESSEGRAGLAILYLGGDDAARVLGTLVGGSLPRGAGRLRLRILERAGEAVDEVLIARVSGGFEIGVHGGPAVVAEVVALLEESGARRTKLGAGLVPEPSPIQLMALELLPMARSEMASRVLMHALSGALDAELLRLGEEPEDEEAWLVELTALAATGGWGPALFDLPTVALIGAPNVGKSTLFNALLGSERVITSARAGTTLDYVDEDVVLAGWPVTLIDTAGLRRSDDRLEVAGMALGRSVAREASLRVLLVDPFDPATELPVGLPEPWLKVVAKADLSSAESRSVGLWVSAQTGLGLEAFAQSLKNLVYPGSPEIPESPALFTEALVKELGRILELAESGRSEEARSALKSLGDG